MQKLLSELERDAGHIIKLVNDDGDELDIEFKHLDGMYSYCEVVTEGNDKGKAVHLSASTPLIKNEGEQFWRIDYDNEADQ